MADIRLAVGVINCRTFADRRERARATWVPQLLIHPDVDVLFVVGDHPSAQEYVRNGDTLGVNCPDDAVDVPRKIGAFLRYAVHELDASLVLICEDDTFVYADRLVTFDPGVSRFVGHARRTVTHVSLVDLIEAEAPVMSARPASEVVLGAGCMLDRTATRILAAEFALPASSDEQSVVTLLKRHGIEPAHDPRFRASWDPADPRGDRIDAITSHLVNSADRAAFLWAQLGHPADECDALLATHAIQSL